MGGGRNVNATKMKYTNILMHPHKQQLHGWFGSSNVDFTKLNKSALIN